MVKMGPGRSSRCAVWIIKEMRYRPRCTSKYMHTKLVYTFLVNWIFPNIHLVKRLYCQYRYNYIRSHWTASSLPNRRVCLRNGHALPVLHCMYLTFVVFGQRAQRGQGPLLSQLWGISTSTSLFYMSFPYPPTQILASRPKSQS